MSEIDTFDAPDSENDNLLCKDTDKAAKRHSQRHFAILYSIITLLSIGLILALFLRKTVSDKTCTAQLNTYSRLANIVEYTTFRYKNDFWGESLYKGPPTIDREAAWNQLWQRSGFQQVPPGKMAALGITSNETQYKKTDPRLGDGYVAYVEGFHMIHCLHLVRQYIYIDWFHEPPVGLRDDNETNLAHVDHCIESLRLTLTCKPDISLFLVKEGSEAEEHGKADFNSLHKCVDWDKLVNWVEAHPTSEGS